MLAIGQTVSYVLKPKDLPIDPDLEYQGIILAICGKQIKVQLIDPEYQGCEEWIDEKQIRSVGESKLGKNVL